MNTLLARHLLCLVVALGATTQAFGSIVLNKDDSNYLGMVEGQPRNSSNPTAEMDNINDLRLLAKQANPAGPYNRLGSDLDGSPFVKAVEAGSIKPAMPTEVSGAYTFNLGAAFQYIYAKYDGPNYGSLVWFFPNGISGDISIPKYAKDSPGEYELSHMSAFNPVPEPTSLLAWGGLAVSGMAVSLIRRKLQK